MTFLDLFSDELAQMLLESMSNTAKVRPSHLPRQIKITESGDYGQVVRVLDTNMFREKPKPKTKRNCKMSNVDENYNKLIKEFNLAEH